MKKLLIVIPGFGPGHIEEKRNFLRNNIKIIRNTFDGEIQLIIFNYSDKAENFSYPYVNVYEKMTKGVVCQFMYKYITPKFVDKYNFDYVLFLLDDIELPQNFNINEVIYNYNEHQLDIISPCLTTDSQISHDIMVTKNKKDYNNKILITNFLEFFCYFMSKNNYKKYYELLNKKCAWLWGIDYLVYHHLKFKLGLLNDCKMKHHYKGESYNPNLPSPNLEFSENMAKIKDKNTDHKVLSTINYIKFTY